ncbi:gamma-glutamyltranspeptidase 1-like [Chlorella sorokiniana]|uniref:Glutathione hydrolase n=1 Tax=Chlorella sorokiniana TaxID=3076 RepID=A0A2P6TRP8_CHLSO|nr:gamma-glutamyltranspeptidase 1-like [Chlorella sorokiniana]|eukprot:PRW56746.1 gamma-glutamyltranspeptidase 1-like [Chlorella sorokiniana]
MTANEGQFGRGFTAIELEATTSGRGWGSAADGGILEPGSGGVRGGLQRVYQRLKQPAVLLGIAGALLILLVAAAAYSTGRRSGRLQVSGCAGLTAPALQGDTVAPEGSIEGSFEALHDYRGRPRSVTAAGGLVAADNGRCSEIGAAVLREGGNAVDAAIATALCQGVLNPQASGAGGGHFMLIRLPNGTAECIDAREFAPGAANETMFVDRPDASISGGLAVAVPLELRGMWTAHHRHGRLPWKRLFQPAIKLAASGFPAHPYLVATLSGESQIAALSQWPAIRDTFLIRQGSKWRGPRVNETCCKRPQLAALLQDVAEEGPDVLYVGKYAEQLAADIQAAGGVITTVDLASAAPVISQPLRRHIWGLDWIGAPPPSSSAAVLAALEILAGYEQPLAGSGSVGVHRMTEALKHAFALRMSLGDPGPTPELPFVDLSAILSALNSSDFIDSLRSSISDSGTLPFSAYGGAFNITTVGAHPEDHGTSHLSVVDADRMAVAMTTTINTGFGSKVLSPSTGLLLNNQMDDFSTPGQPNVYGIAPSKANFIRPRKKPFSSMSPLIAERNGSLVLAIGASGGPRIISAVLQACVRLVAYGEGLFPAVANPRLHHQLTPNLLYVEDWNATGVAFKYDADTAELLATRGHNVSSTAWGAVTQAILVDADTGELHGVSDPRKDGAPAAA